MTTYTTIPLRTHNHQAVAGGGQLDHGVAHVAASLDDDDHAATYDTTAEIAAALHSQFAPIFYPVLAGDEGTGAAGVNGRYGSVAFADGSELVCYATGRTPFTPTRIDVLLWAAATGNTRLSFNMQFGLATELYSANDNAIAEFTQALTVNVVTLIDVSALLGAMTGDEYFGLEIRRHGDDVLDTIGQTVVILGVLLTP